MKISRILFGSLCIFTLFRGTSSLPHYLPDHDFIPPNSTDYGVYGGLNISRQRGPCPALNTLANHGYINRNGTDVSFKSIKEGAVQAFGIPEILTDVVFVVVFGVGMRHVRENEDGDQIINLFDLYDGSRHDASSVRDDRFFNKYSQFNETLFQMLISNSKNGSMNYHQAVASRLDRIIDSRRNNPEFNLVFGDLDTATLLYATFTFGQFIYGNLDPMSVETRTLRSFFQENRIPDDFVPVYRAGLMDKLMDTVTEYESVFKQALGGNLEDVEHTSESPREGLIVGLVVGGVGAIVIVLLLAFFTIKKKRQEQKMLADFGASISKHDAGFAEIPRKKSMLSERVVPKDLAWNNITVKTKDNCSIVSGLSGIVQQGKLTGLLGHSGSGKTTLLKMLQGNAKSLKAQKLSVNGNIYVNGKEVEQTTMSLSKHVAFVAQEDVLVETATPKEAIRFAARMRLPKNKSDQYVEDLTEQILGDLRLKHVQDRVMSGKNGLSGGEKRRVSFGLALVTEPSILLLDEITSGLDSYSASQIVDICYHLTHVRGTAVFMSLHQPSRQMVSKLDRVMLLRSGKCMFELPTSDISSMFHDAGYPVPEEEFTVIDWALEVSQQRSLEELQSHGFFRQKDQSVGFTNRVHCDGGGPLDTTSDSTTVQSDPVIVDEKNERISFVTEVKELAHRVILSYKRNWKLHVIKIAVPGALSCMFFLFAWQIGEDSLKDLETFMSHVGVVFLMIDSAPIVLLMEAPEVAAERLTFAREYSTGHFRLISYALVQSLYGLLQLIPFCLFSFTIMYFAAGFQSQYWYLAGVCWLFLAVNSAIGHFVTGIPRNPSHAQLLSSLALFPQFVLCGYIITFDSMPEWSRWLILVNPMTYAFRLALGEEFRVCTEFTRKEQEVVNCAEALANTLTRGKVSAEDVGVLYSDQSVLNVMQAGSYKGQDAILEYLGFLSFGENNVLALLHDPCSLKKTQIARLNSADGGVCDISFVETIHSKLNPALEMNDKDEIEETFFRFVFGNRIRFDYSDDLTSVSVQSHSMYFPEVLLPSVLDKSRQSRMAALTCFSFEQSCPNEYGANNFGSYADCIHTMRSDIPMYTASEETGLVTIDANSTGCRFLHVGLAGIHPEAHCPHVSFLPMEDPNGITKCSEGSNMAYEDYFDDKDMTLFQEAAIKGGLDINAQVSVSSNDDESQCSASIFDFPSASDVRSDILPSNFVCYGYLKTQGSTGEQQMEYWIALISFFVFFRGLGFLLFVQKSRI